MVELCNKNKSHKTGLLMCEMYEKSHTPFINLLITRISIHVSMF